MLSVLIVLFDDVQSLDVTGPLEVFNSAGDTYRITTAGIGGHQVCTGSLILAGAGLLKGRRATTHWLALAQLTTWDVTPVHERVVIDGKYATAAGVSAGIDMALTLAGRLAGDTVAQRIQLGIEYYPQPPYQAGSPDTAPEELVADIRAHSRFTLNR
jgi:putative intracellular protease/amidase